MLFGPKGVDENCIAFAVNQRDSIGHPGESLLSRGDTLSGAITFLGQKLPIQLRHDIFLSLYADPQTRSSKMSAKPVDGRVRGGFEFAHVRIEVTGLDHCNALRLQRAFVSLDREISDGEVIGRGGHHHYRRRRNRPSEM